MNKREKQSVILNLLIMNKVGIGALLENKMKKDKVDDMMAKLFLGWDYYSSNVREGRILVLWQKSFIKVQVLLEQQQFVHCLVKLTGMQMDILVTFVYGLNTMDERLEMWRGPSFIHVLNKPWLIVGDFNVVFNFDDRAGGRTISAAEILDSKAWLAHTQLASLKSIGSNFIWSNKQDGGDRVYSKIDHVFINEDWIDALPNSIAEFQWDVHSDHCYFLIKTLKLGNLGIKPFREEIGDVEQGYHQAKGDYQLALTRAQASPTYIAAQEAEKIAADRYQDHSAREENHIISFLNEQGVIIDDYNEVVHHFLDHLRGYVGISSSANSTFNSQCIELGPCLDIEMQLSLTREFRKSDVKKALFSIPGTKSPGSDGYGFEFYKAMWQNIGDDISEAILEFFHYEQIPAELNETVLALVPKTDMPSRAVNYRPIACCNTLYKCISKMICSRLSEVLPNLISQNQGAFVKGRSLAHNILIFQDLIKNYNRRNTSLRFIHWVMVCLCGTSYVLMLNGRLQGGFRSVKGLRQGDPISPLLLKVINLCFADDLVIFYKANSGSAQIVKHVFEEFCSSTGLKANLSKSQVFFGGVSAAVKVQLLQILQLEEGTFPLKYLGIPMRPTKWKVADCGEILKKLN
ncbi:uncharacterized protein LOC133815532 [Humulus lupulus]|uniref:uncharacterized protein LOC133815532 n=1 Tax=Humulus lupulus TaxID=3486 RepID=UPI002B402342|nr:uncharacterized protein LOC133815532 [Humulus lupulus]